MSNKLKKYLDNKFPKGWCGYSPVYTLTHPWVIPPFLIGHVKWAWQRVFRGFDDRVIWSIDSYLAENIPLWLRKLKSDKQGTPAIMFQEEDYSDENCSISDETLKKRQAEYDQIIDKIIFGFQAYTGIQNNEYKFKSKEEELAKEYFKQGMDLFVEYFSTFWY